MVFDEYDMKRHGKNVYDHTINVYRKDIIEDILINFKNENNIEMSSYTSDEITRLITNIRNSYNILDHRYITCISGRIAHGEEPKWYLFNVFR